MKAIVRKMIGAVPEHHTPQNQRREENTMRKSMNQIIAEYKEYAKLEAELKEQMEILKAQAIEILGEQAVDEYTCDEGKVTYRDVISNRFCSTEFKKIHEDLYKAFCKPTTSKRFTCN